MEYTVIVNGQSYDLPKKTMKVAEDIDKLLKADTDTRIALKDKYKKQFDFIRGLIGEDNAKEIFATDDINEIDLPEITLTVKKIMDAYDKPINDYEIEKSREKISDLPLDKVIELAKVAREMPQKK
jgi:hypothetical protein